MIKVWVLLVVSVQLDISGEVYSKGAPTVAMQEFSSKEACLYAQEQLTRKADKIAEKLRMVCVPK